MDYKLKTNANIPILECVSGIMHPSDGVALAFACGNADTELLLIHSAAFPAEFFDLRCGFAGDFIQKLVNFRIRTAAVFKTPENYSERFGEFLREAEHAPQFRAFYNVETAQRWLKSLV